MAPPSARVLAANCLLDRGHGKAVQDHSLDITDNNLSFNIQLVATSPSSEADSPGSPLVIENSPTEFIDDTHAINTGVDLQ